MHEDNDICPVAYLHYDDLELEDKSQDELDSDGALMSELIEKRKTFSLDHLNDYPFVEVPRDKNYSPEVEDEECFLDERLTFSASRIQPGIDLKSISQKDQMLIILNHMKSLNITDYILKVGLLVTDLGEFKDLNAEYVKFFGLKPPVRVCVQIPGDEVIMYALVYRNRDNLEQF